MNNYPGEQVDNWKDLAIGAAIVQAIGAAWLYLRSIGNKLDKSAHEAAIKSLNESHKEEIADLRAEIEKAHRRVGQYEDKLKDFARQTQVDEVKSDIRRLETKIESKLDSIQQQLLMLISRDK